MRTCPRCGNAFTPYDERLKYCSRACAAESYKTPEARAQRKATLAAAKARGLHVGRPRSDFWSRVNKSGKCWLWTGGLNAYGYGLVGSGTKLFAHRFSYELTNGPIPDGLCVLHRCDVRRCVRPEHLFLGTRADNSADMVRKDRQHRPAGEKNNNARLTADLVREIRRRYETTGERVAQARDLGIAVSSVDQILARKTWRHV